MSDSPGQQIPPIVNLHYHKGDLIIKEGDFGLSIYKILQGEVKIIKEAGKKEIALATLGPGEIFGEMAFLNRMQSARTASARAISDVTMEVWHPARFANEFNTMPPILKYIARQMIERLIHLNLTLGKLAMDSINIPEPEGQLAKRRYYRKPFNRGGFYRPKGSVKDIEIPARINDISMLGLSMEISASAVRQYRHKPGDLVLIYTTLANGQELEMEAKLISIKPGDKQSRIMLGMEFIELRGDTAKKLGFFMMT